MNVYPLIGKKACVAIRALRSSTARASLACLALGAISPQVAALEPAHPTPTQAARDLLNFIAFLPTGTTDRCLSGQLAFPRPGQQTNIDADYAHYIGDLTAQTGEYVAVIGAHLGRGTADDPYPGDYGHSPQNMAPYLITHHEYGGIVTVSPNFINPWTGNYSQDKQIGSIAEILPGGIYRAAWTDVMDWYIDELLLDLKEAGVPVIFRPFHEFNGGWFWWGYQALSDPEDFKALWIDTFNYFKSRGLNNMLWSFSFASNGANPEPKYTRYPGGQYVDTIGLDYYRADPDVHTQAVYNVASLLGKPFAITEGQRSAADNGGVDWDYTDLIADIKNHMPNTSYFMPWGGAHSLIENNENGLLSDAWVLNRGEFSIPSTSFQYFISEGTKDGWVLESGENTDAGGTIDATSSGVAALRAGDNAVRRQYKMLVSFDTSALPDTATILGATLRLTRGTLVGSVTSLGALRGDIRINFNANSNLEAADFSAAETAAAVITLPVPLADGDLAAGNLTSAGLAVVNKTGRTQFRLYFETDDNNDVIADYLGFYSGDHANASKRPVLEVVYQ